MADSGDRLFQLAWIRLLGPWAGIYWNGRGHFFGAAAQNDAADSRGKCTSQEIDKAGGKFNRVQLSQVLHEVQRKPENVDVDDALKKLEEIEPRRFELIRLRFFAGLPLAEAARALGVSGSTADNDWAYAKAWLRVEMAESD